jgi:predicted ATPase
MIFEDAHWADPTSLELFSRVVERIAAVRVLLIVTFRPEFEPPWIGRPHVTALTINRLAQRDIDAMIDRVVGSKPPSGEHPSLATFTSRTRRLARVRSIWLWFRGLCRT